MNKTKKIISFLLLTIILFSNFSNIMAQTISNSEKINLVYGHDCVSVLKIKGKDMLKQVAYVYYEDTDTHIRYPAFCVQPDKNGIGTGAGNSYDVFVSQLDDPILWRMLYYGYVGSTYQKWGLECDDDLYFATKTAVHCYADGSTPTGKYELPTRLGRGDETRVTLEQARARGAQVLAVAQKIYDDAINNTNENYIKASVTISKGSQEESTFNGIKYLVQNYNVTANKELSSYEVNISNFPTGTRILNSSNIDSTTMNNSTLKIAIPVTSILEDFTGYITVFNAKVKSFPIFYANSGNDATQNYVLSDPSEVVSAKTTLNIDAHKSSIKVIKEDSETKYKIPNVVFNFKYANGENIGNYTTDSNGEITVTKLKQGTIIATELETNENYILDTTEKEINLSYAESKLVNITNERKKGNLQVFKVDKDNNKIALGNVKFDLFSYEQNKVIGTYYTDVNGMIYIEGLRVADYSLIEKETNKWYNLAENTNVKVEWDKTTNTIIENELKKGQIKIIKVDNENNEIKLDNVKFGVYDENNNLLETIVTNKEGEALTRKYPIRDFESLKLIELETKEEYVLNDTPQIITLEENQIKNIKFENKKIKGTVEITKIDKKDNSKLLEGAKFGLYDENNNLIDTLVTNVEGKATSKELYKGKYYLKELETGSIYYLLNENTFEFEIVKNHEIVPITIENEPVDIEVTVDKEGTTEIKPGEKVNYEFSNVGNASNIYLENFKWFDYIPTDYIRLETMTTGTWNQDMTYSVYYKTNKSNDYILFKENLKTTENYNLDFTIIELTEDEYIVETCFDFGKVDVGFKEETSPTMECISFDTLQEGETFTNHTKTIGTYWGITAEANSKWTTVPHIPKEPHEPVLPRTRKINLIV